MSQSPHIGSIVHYRVSAYGGPLAAIVTAVLGDGSVDLTVFLAPEDMREAKRLGLSTGRCPHLRVEEGVFQAEKPTPGCWNWPPRV